MRALVVADVHLDTWTTDHAFPLEALAAAEWASLNLVVLAGDLTNRGHERWTGALGWLGERLDLARLHVFPGNHDLYGGDLDREDKLQAAAEAAGAHYAQKAEIVLGGRRFLCCTLWTDMALGGSQEANVYFAEHGMNDYRKIRIAADHYRAARAADTVAVHRDHRRWLEERLAAPFPGDTVVVTHHAPHPACLGARFPHSSFAAAYASDLSALIEEHRPALWLYGHTHAPADFTVGATRVLNVSIGYPPSVDTSRGVGDPQRGLLEW